MAKDSLDDQGYGDWHHITKRLKDHEKSLDHLTNRNKWFEMRKRLKMNETIDKIQHEQFKKERDYWKHVLLRIIAVVKFLAKHNLAFRGSKENFHEKGNYKLQFLCPYSTKYFFFVNYYHLFHFLFVICI